MKNHEAARGLIRNALAYLKSGDVETVKHNLEHIEELLKDAEAENTEFDWDDFK